MQVLKVIISITYNLIAAKDVPIFAQIYDLGK